MHPDKPAIMIKRGINRFTKIRRLPQKAWLSKQNLRFFTPRSAGENPVVVAVGLPRLDDAQALPFPQLVFARQKNVCVVVVFHATHAACVLMEAFEFAVCRAVETVWDSSMIPCNVKI